jgi:MerR family transcriptional regulator, heat shock protein HspR
VKGVSKSTAKPSGTSSEPSVTSTRRTSASIQPDVSRTHDETTPVFVISVAAELTGLHAQTLRQYDRVGLVSPGRTPAGGRRYSLRDVAELRQVARLSAMGVGLEGVRRILELENQVSALRQRIAELQEQVDDHRAASRRTSLVVWRPPLRPL